MKRWKYLFVKNSLLTLFVCLLFLPGYQLFEKTGENFFHVSVNGVEVGTVAERERADELLVQARREVAETSDELTFIEAELTVTGEEVLWGTIDDEDDVCARMREVLQANVQETMQHAYTLKMNEYLVNLATADEVQELLQAALDKYGADGRYTVSLVQDESRGFGVLTSVITAETEESDASGSAQTMLSAGVQTVLWGDDESESEDEDKAFEDYELGLKSMSFSEKVEVVEAYLPEGQLTDLQTAMDEVIKEQETPGEYTIQAGDTLSEIAINVNIPVDEIVEMNSDKLEDENSTIREGDTLIITVPEPELSVERVEEKYYEESYDADIIYIDRDDWYTTQTNVVQQPSAGFRKIVAKVSYVNDTEVSREILKEEVVMEAVPMIMERGTKIPPTYIKPISGGRLSSGFGKRTAPTKGASTYHKGVDWAVATGTSVYASCGGTVSKAGWGSGYGYVVYIDHEDGRQTRYGHLSKILVKVGQTVKQGEKIALSGNTGVSTGPHLHFEILINGTQVNPLKYLE